MIVMNLLTMCPLVSTLSEQQILNMNMQIMYHKMVHNHYHYYYYNQDDLESGRGRRLSDITVMYDNVL